MSFNPLNLFRRARAWKAFIEQMLSGLSSRHDQLRQQHDQLHQQITTTNKLQARQFHRQIILPLTEEVAEAEGLGEAYEVLVARRASQLVVLFSESGCVWHADLAGEQPSGLLEAVLDGDIDEVVVLVPNRSGEYVIRRSTTLLDMFRRKPFQALAWLVAHAPKAPPIKENDKNYFSALAEILADVDRIDFRAIHAARQGVSRPPFDQPENLPTLRFAEPRRRSALFLHNNYYHFNCLSAGLRNRGWDALTVSVESPDSLQRQFYHGEDVNLFDADHSAMSRKIRDFFRTVPEKYGAVHFCGQGLPTFFPELMENSETPQIVPWDFVELRRHRIIIGYMPSGCADGGLQSSIRQLTGGVCSRCVWELRPDVCSDARNLVWNRKLALLCDWVGLECDHATPERIGDRTVYGPVVTALDPERWRPGLDVPEDMRVERELGEVLIYHGVGNYTSRRTADRDIKGTGAVMAAVEALKAEGLPVKLIFAHQIPSTKVRFLQTQADIVVDQLNYGRYGANAREAMMLGKATVCRLHPKQALHLPPLRPIIEVPMVDATEESIVNVLRSLVVDPARRTALGAKSREFALAWHGQDACAERYERVTDRIRAGLLPDSPDLYPV